MSLVTHSHIAFGDSYLNITVTHSHRPGETKAITWVTPLAQGNTKCIPILINYLIMACSPLRLNSQGMHTTSLKRLKYAPSAKAPLLHGFKLCSTSGLRRQGLDPPLRPAKKGNGGFCTADMRHPQESEGHADMQGENSPSH